MPGLATKLTRALNADRLPQAMWVKTGSTHLAHGAERTLSQTRPGILTSSNEEKSIE